MGAAIILPITNPKIICQWLNPIIETNVTVLISDTKNLATCEEPIAYLKFLPTHHFF